MHRIRQGRARDDQGRLGEAIGRQESLAAEPVRRQQLGNQAQHGGVDSLCPDDRRPPSAEVETAEVLRPHPQRDIAVPERGCRRDRGGSTAHPLQQEHRPAQEVLGPHQPELAAVDDRGQQGADETHVVMKWQPARRPALGVHPQQRAYLVDVRLKAGPGYGHTARLACGTRGELGQRQILPGGRIWTGPPPVSPSATSATGASIPASADARRTTSQYSALVITSAGLAARRIAALVSAYFAVRVWGGGATGFGTVPAARQPKNAAGNPSPVGRITEMVDPGGIPWSRMSRVTPAT